MKLKLLAIITYIIISLILIYLLKPFYLPSLIIIIGIPAIANWLFLNYQQRKKIMIFSLITTILFAPPVELAARLAQAWEVQTIFPQIFGYVPIENMIFAFFNFLWVLSFYEYFITRQKSPNHISFRFKYLLLLYFVLNLIVYILFFVNPEIITLNYIVLAIPILIIPGLIIFSLYPKIIPKTIWPTLFFALVFLAYELIALELGHWWWPGEYLWPIEIGSKIFPLDDVLIWYLLSTPVLIGGYEIFVNGYKKVSN